MSRSSKTNPDVGRFWLGGLAAVFLVALPRSLPAQPELEGAAVPALAAPTELIAADHPSDNGTAIDLSWKLSPDDRSDRESRRVRGYDITRTLLDSPGEGEKPIETFSVPYQVNSYVDRKCRPGCRYLYEVAALGTDKSRSPSVFLPGSVIPVRQWFDRSRSGFALVLLFVCGAVIYFTERTKSGKSLHVREIAALRAMQEAVGRATEMGKPCLFIPGVEDMNEISTVAGIAILSHVAQIAAEYDAEIYVPTARSLVMTAAAEAVSGAYLAADRADAFNSDRVYYVSDEQFAYVAHATGFMAREKPAACFYAGVFFAESLILAETGNSVGAIQIAGTSEAAQLPFFVAACDYTLIGEELFAASAYLTREPQQLGSLKGQDAGKLFAGLLLTVGCLLATASQLAPGWQFPGRVLTYLTQSLLGGGMAE